MMFADISADVEDKSEDSDPAHNVVDSADDSGDQSDDSESFDDPVPPVDEIDPVRKSEGRTKKKHDVARSSIELFPAKGQSSEEKDDAAYPSILLVRAKEGRSRASNVKSASTVSSSPVSHRDKK